MIYEPDRCYARDFDTNCTSEQRMAFRLTRVCAFPSQACYAARHTQIRDVIESLGQCRPVTWSSWAFIRGGKYQNSCADPGGTGGPDPPPEK